MLFKNAKKLKIGDFVKCKLDCETEHDSWFYGTITSVDVDGEGAVYLVVDKKDIQGRRVTGWFCTVMKNNAHLIYLADVEWNEDENEPS